MLLLLLDRLRLRLYSLLLLNGFLLLNVFRLLTRGSGGDLDGNWLHQIARR